MARKFRDAELPFKLYDIPEVDAASTKWTDEYVGYMFGDPYPERFARALNEYGEHVPIASGVAQESPSKYYLRW